MSVELITILLFGGLLFFLMMGVPIFIAMGGIAVIFTLFFKGPNGLYTLEIGNSSQGRSVFKLIKQ